MTQPVEQPRVTKQQAGYMSPSPWANQCGNCIMFRTGSCDLVSGLIETGAVCQFWQPEED